MVADFDASDNCLDVVATQRGFVGTQFFTHQLGEAFDKLGRDSAFGVCELRFEHDDIGLNIDKLFGQTVPTGTRLPEPAGISDT